MSGLLDGNRRTVPIEPPSDGHRRLALSLLGAFKLQDGDARVVLSGGSQRLLAFIALQGRPLSRDTVVKSLWPERLESQAHACLRSAIWRLEELAQNSTDIDALELDLAPNVALDLTDAQAMARRILLVDTMPDESDMTREAIEVLSSELLPDWYDDWVLILAEDWHQLRRHALEALAQNSSMSGASPTRSRPPPRPSGRTHCARVRTCCSSASTWPREPVRGREEVPLLLQALRREPGFKPTAALLVSVRGLPP